VADLNYVPQVDYTSRDYLSIRDDLLALIPTFAPQWTNRDPADFGIVLLQMFAYMGDLQSYYIDRAGNEAFISTASKRSSILRHASLLDYQPTQSTPAIVQLTFTNNSDPAESIVVPAKSRVATTTTVSGENAQIIFETNTAITVPGGSAPNNTASVIATQGFTIEDEIVTGQATGQPNQVYPLENTSVIEDSVSVTIDGVVYEKTQYLIDAPGTTPAFTTVTDADGLTYVQFGDNIGGRIPPLNKTIYATYRVGGGTEGNVSAGSLTEILTGFSSGITVTNQSAAAGGEDPESTDSIKVNAPLSLKSLNRAVSLSDYASLTLQVSGIAKANATSEAYSSVIVYFAPFGDRGVESDNVTPTTIFSALRTNVANYLQGKAPANTSVTIAPPSYVAVDIKLAVTVLPQYRQSSIQAAVTSAINEILAFDNVLFSDRISLQYLMRTIASVPGVDFTEVQLLRRNDTQQLFNISNKALTSNVATLTTTTTHNLTAGQVVAITDIDSTFNGTYAVASVPTTTTFTYAKVATNVSSAAIAGPLTVTNKQRTGTTATLTTSTVHSLDVGQTVTIVSVDSELNGKVVITDIPTTTTFTYTTATSGTIASAVVSGGSVQIALVQALVVNDVVCAINEIPEAGQIDITASGGITN
jgi:hypothetical protein